MAFRPEIYKQAAAEHVATAATLYEAEQYVLSSYVSGLAVECILRAYRVLHDPEFFARHDLWELSRVSKWRDHVASRDLPVASAALEIVYRRWSNSHRYQCLASYRRFLQRLGLHAGIKGDFVKEQSRLAVRAAERFVEIGVRSWPTS